MNKNLNNLKITIVMLLLFGTVIPGQIKKKAQVGFRFLDNPISAEVVGKGNVGVVGGSSANSIFWNPALMGKMKNKWDVSLNHTQGIADINYNAVAVSMNLEDYGVISASLFMMDYGDFYGTVRANNEKGYTETGAFSPSAFAASIAYSKEVTERFSYGVNIKYARQELGDAYVSEGSSFEDSTFSLSTIEYKKGVIAIDVGAYYDFLYKGVKFGATLQNISPEVKYEIQKFPLPFTVSFGAAIEPLLFFNEKQKDHSLIVSIESRHPRDFGEKVKFGSEYTFRDIFIARLGYQSNYDERGWNLGLGVKQKLIGYQIRFDYALEPFGIFGNRHFISIGLSY